jgi:protein ImuA
MMSNRNPTLAALRERVSRMVDADGQQSGEKPSMLTTGHTPFDAAVGGGLACGRLHEFYTSDPLDAPSAAAFAALMALREARPDQPLIWLRSRDAGRKGGQIYAPGLMQLGGNPDQLLLVEVDHADALLAAANDAVRCAGSAAVVIESWGAFPKLDLTAGRKLALGARHAGTALLLLRLAAKPTASVAETRWMIGSAASQALEANAPGAPAFALELLRWRAGPAGTRWCLEWNVEQHIFGEAALSGPVLPMVAGGADQPRRIAAA